MSADIGKARTFLYYLSRSHKKISERDLARGKVVAAIHRLKKLSTEDIQQDLDVLQHSVDDALQKERTIITKQTVQETIHDALGIKIDALQQKLGTYIDTRQAREHRLRQLEDKIFHVTKPKTYNVLYLKRTLAALEKKYYEEKACGDHTERELSEVSKKIEELKDRIWHLEGM